MDRLDPALYVPGVGGGRAAARPGCAGSGVASRRQVLAGLGALAGSIGGAPATGGDASALLPPGEWRLTFRDEFQALSLREASSRGTWTTDYGWGGVNSFTLPENGERQVYASPRFAGAGSAPLGLDPFEIRDGHLAIRADRAPRDLWPLLWGRRYVSGLLTTRDSFSQTYGCFAIRARVPRGRGLWPAFWLLPVDGGDSAAEIDVVETLGHDPAGLWTTCHFGPAGPRHGKAQRLTRVQDLSLAFHVFAVVWTRQAIAWYLDGRLVFETPTPGDLHGPMYMLVNLAVGGHWPGDPDASTVFPARFEIDWVRAYTFA